MKPTFLLLLLTFIYLSVRAQNDNINIDVQNEPTNANRITLLKMRFLGNDQIISSFRSNGILKDKENSLFGFSLWNLKTGKQVNFFNTQYVNNGYELSKDEKYIFYVERNSQNKGTLYKRDISTGEIIKEITGSDEFYDSGIKSSTDGKYIVWFSIGNLLRKNIVDKETMEIVQTGYFGEKEPMAFVEGRYVEIGINYIDNVAQEIFVQDVFSENSKRKRLKNERIEDFLISPNNEFVFIHTKDYLGDKICTYNIKKNSFSRLIKSKSIYNSFFTPDSKNVIITSNNDNTSYFYNIEKNEIIDSISSNCNGNHDFSADGNYMVVTGYNEVQLWNLTTRKQETTLPVDGICVKISPDMSRIACTSMDATLQLFDFKTKEKILSIIPYEMGEMASATKQVYSEMPKIGQLRKDLGGYVIYLDPNGKNGAVCATEDQGSYQWGCGSKEIYGADATGVYSGAENTKDILTGCDEQQIAAKVCDTLVLNEFDDWYLPSFEELQLMYNLLFKKGIGKFAEVEYWSSSEYSNENSYFIYFKFGAEYNGYKNNTYTVRAVRKF